MLCSCRTCQKRTGTALGISAYWPEDKIMISGPSTIWVREGQDGRKFEQHFCPTCGSTLWWRGDFAPGMIGVAGGNFDDGNFLEPTRAFWAMRRPKWLASALQVKSLEQQG
jgi:hypothetical protein